MAADVMARALAHTLTCTTCREQLAAERGLRQSLQQTAAPGPSESLLVNLIALDGAVGADQSPRSAWSVGRGRVMVLAVGAVGTAVAVVAIGVVVAQPRTEPPLSQLIVQPRPSATHTVP
jgi:hypothetical protein